MAQITQTLSEEIYKKVKAAAESKGITVQALIAYHIGEIYGSKPTENKK